MKVLFLSLWYPHRYDAMSGLFVRKHAQAVSNFCEVKVLYVYTHTKVKQWELVQTQSDQVGEFIVYFPSPENNLISKGLKPLFYLIAYLKGLKAIYNSGFHPDLVHANVLTRTMLIAYLLKLWTNTPYVITEHWSRYLESRKEFKGYFRKKISQLVVKNASAVMPVSEILKQAMLKHKLINHNFQIVYNVVDDFFFTEKSSEKRSKKRLIHISCFDEKAKNIFGILRSMRQIVEQREDVELYIIGTGVDFDKTVEYYKSLCFPENAVYFQGELTPQEVAQYLYNSDAFILFSNYETAGVVLAESLSCGKPIISTKVGIAPEIVSNECGILLDVGNEIGLTAAINQVLDNLESYSTNKMQERAKQLFSSAKIGNQLLEIYTKAIKQNK